MLEHFSPTLRSGSSLPLKGLHSLRHPTNQKICEDPGTFAPAPPIVICVIATR